MKILIHVLTCLLFVTGNSFSQGIISFSPTNIIGGIGQTLTISGSGFGNTQGTSYVSFYQEGGTYSAGTPLVYSSWTNTQIVLQMPVAYSNKIKVNINGGDVSSTDTLHVRANLGYRTASPILYDLLSNQNTKGGYTWWMHRSYFQNPAIKAAIEAVFKEFRCETGINYMLSAFPSDASLTLNDNINLIARDSVLGAAGYTDKLWASCILGGETFYSTTTQDIRLSTTQNWYFGSGYAPSGQVKFRYVLMHELGHALGLGHVNELGQTMYPTVTLLPSSTWSGRDIITTEEKQAISYFVNRSQTFAFRGCGYTPLSTIFDCNDIYGLQSGITGNENKSTINIFPNPTNGWVHIDLDNLQRVTIYDYSGKELFSRSTPDLDLNLYPPSYYILKIETEKQTIYRKIIKY